MIQRFLDALVKNRWQGMKVVHHAVLPPREPGYGEPDEPIPEALGESLRNLGITKLYSHQVEALNHIRSGRNIVVATPTSSGKSLIYNLAVTEALMEDPGLHALYLFPIKALTRDQMDSLETFFHASFKGRENPAFHAAVYDGDTTPHQRAKIRQKHPSIILTNPDMLHYGLLPYHGKWESFWKKLRFVVVDELHTYRGIFGSHVGQIFRRLQRICRHYGSAPQFIMLSATIANPRELAEQLIRPFGPRWQQASAGQTLKGKTAGHGVSTGFGPEAPENGLVTVIENHGAPQSRRHFIFMESEEGAAGHPSGIAARLLVRAAESGLKTIAFTQSRRVTELVHMSVLRMAPRLTGRVSSYRAGFLPEERRGIEQKLSSGALAAVISTSALEMGIDIGGLDLCILVGYPGTVMTTWQRGGRVGRSGRESAIVLLPQPDALDQYIIHHPGQFLESGYEIAIADPMNEEILKAHLPCAATELPLRREELEDQPPAVERAVIDLSRAGRLMETAEGNEWLPTVPQPHRQVDLRSVGESYAIILNNRSAGKKVPLGKSEGLRALKECHPGAVYLHRGESYLVEKLDLTRRVIHVIPSQVPYYTRVKSEKETEILEVLSSKPVGNFLTRLGRLRVTERITGYEKRRLFTQELLDSNGLDLPPQIFETVGFWIEIEQAVARRIHGCNLHFMGGIHAMEHAAISMFPLFALCDRNDIGGISSPMHHQVGKGAIFIYDGYPGGIGLAERGYAIIEELLRKARELIASCDCPEGCPACIHSPKCGSGNKPLDKEAALTVLRILLGELSLSDEEICLNMKQEDTPPPAVQPMPDQPPSRRIGFFDLETQRLAQEVGGWGNKHLMRVSVAILYDTLSEDFHIYREEEIQEFIRHLQELDLVVGFNVSRFDYEVLKAYTPFDFGKLPTLDLLQEIYRQLGFRISLDHLAQTNLGKAKTSDGIQAVQWFRDGDWKSLIDHCKLDVILTRDLFQIAMKQGYLVYADRRGKLLRVPMEPDLDSLIRQTR